MTIIDTLNKMQQDAVDQLRAGDHNEFLVGFLTTSVMLELSNLVASDLDLNEYAQAAVEVLTQHAPIDCCLIGLEPHELPSVAAGVAFDLDLAAKHAELEAGPDTAPFDVDGVVTGTLHVGSLPDALHDAGFIERAAQQIANGLVRVVEVSSCDARPRPPGRCGRSPGSTSGWNVAELETIAQAFAALPAVTGATINATAALRRRRRHAGRPDLISSSATSWSTGNSRWG